MEVAIEREGAPNQPVEESQGGGEIFVRAWIVRAEYVFDLYFHRVLRRKPVSTHEAAEERERIHLLP
jgi:hypothetical protein